MGSPEIVILIVLAAIILLPLLIRAAGRRDLRRGEGWTKPADSTTVTQLPPEPMELPGVRAAIDRGDWQRAVDLYHEASGLPRAKAESAVMSIVEPGPSQAESDRTEEPPASDGEDWPGLPDRNRRKGG